MGSCPNCDADLLGVSCKLRCPRCGYFESCSDLEPAPLLPRQGPEDPSVRQSRARVARDPD